MSAKYNYKSLLFNTLLTLLVVTGATLLLIGNFVLPALFLPLTIAGIATLSIGALPILGQLIPLAFTSIKRQLKKVFSPERKDIHGYELGGCNVPADDNHFYANQKKDINEYELERCNVPGGGNCFFHAIVKGLNHVGKKDYTHQQLRELASSAVLGQNILDAGKHQLPLSQMEVAFQDREGFKTLSLEEYDKLATKNGVYANQTNIFGLANAINANIVIIEANESVNHVVAKPHQPNNETITLYVHYDSRCGGHYQALLPTKTFLAHKKEASDLLAAGKFNECEQFFQSLKSAQAPSLSEPSDTLATNTLDYSAQTRSTSPDANDSTPPSSPRNTV